MKIATLVARLLLGLVFTVFGLNGFLNFMKGPMPPGVAGQFLGAMMSTHYVFFVAGVQILAGLSLLTGQFLTLGMVLSGALLANIVAFHLAMLPHEAVMAWVCAALWLVIAAGKPAALAPVFSRKS